MRKKLQFLFLTLAGMMCSGSTWAQTDVTSMYLTNAGFDDATACTSANLWGDSNSFNDVTGWTKTASGWGATAAFAYGSTTAKMNNQTAPATDKSGNATGNCIGLQTAWTASSVYSQEVTLPAGTYTLKFDVINYNTTTNYTSKTGFTGGDGYYISFPDKDNGWTTQSLTFELNEETTGNIQIGYTSANTGSGNTPKLFFDNVILLSGIDLTSWNNAKINAQTALDSYDASYAATERQAVINAKNVADPTTAAGLTTALQTLNDAVATYTKKAAYEKLIVDKQPLVDFISNINTSYPNSSTALFPADLSAWTGSTYVANNGSEHWSGVKTYYYEQTGSQWGQDSWNIAAEKTVNLPVGRYAFVVTARASVGCTSTMTVDGEEVALSHVGGTGYGITTDGTASYDMAGTYANTTGRGWEYAYAEFEVTEARDVTISFAASASAKNNWVSIANPVLYYDNTAKAAMELIDAKATLKAALDAHPTLTHVSDSAFDYSPSAGNAYNKTVTDAQAVYDNPSATLTDVQDQTTYVNALTVPALNAPSSTQAYKIILAGNGEWAVPSGKDFAGEQMDNTAITPAVNTRNNMGNYNVYYRPQNDNYAQAMYFNTVEGGYTISFTDADGYTRYICTGTPYSGNNYQIRTTTTADDAMVITISRNGDYINLYNVAASDYIGAQDAGVYTVNSHINFAVEETTATNTVEVDMTAGYATVCLPYAATLSSGKAYSVTDVEGNGRTLTMTEATTLEANKAYILEGSTNYMFNGVNIAYAAPAANGLLTGVYTATTAPADSYVLLNKAQGVGFYKVVEDDEPTVGANRCYLTKSSETKAFFFDNATAIKTIESLTSGSAKIYDLNGRELKSLQKGINIVGGKKILVK